MSFCEYCGCVGGYHYFGCTAPKSDRQSGLELMQPYPPQPDPIKEEPCKQQS